MTVQRSRMVRLRTLIVGAVVPTVALLVAPATSAGEPSLDLLVFTRTEGFSHPSIADGEIMIGDIASQEGFAVTITSDNTDFNPGFLAGFDVVIWLSTTGDVLDPAEQMAFEEFIQAGGGYVGIHAAADCEYDWPWYGQLLGNDAWFASHPSQQAATMDVEFSSHPGAGTFAPSTTNFTEEWYNFRNNPRVDVDVIMTLDESTYDPGSDPMGADHPIAWAHHFDGGRAFYTGLGHRPQTYSVPAFVEQIRGAIQWAGGLARFSDGFETGDIGRWTPTE